MNKILEDTEIKLRNDLKVFTSELLEIDEFDFLSAVNVLADKKENFFYWNEPAENFSILGIGEAFAIKENGNGRTSRTAEIVNEFKNKIDSNWEGNSGLSVPLFLGGIKFSSNSHSKLWQDFSDADWFIPTHLFFSQDGKNYYVFNSFRSNASNNAEQELKKIKEFIKNGVNKGESSAPKIVRTNLEDDNERQRWFSLVNSALEFISRKAFKKIVLSREVTLELDSEPDLSSLLNKLNSNYPHCYVFAFSKKGLVFFGASPEKLAKFRNGWIEADALAGSIPRGRDESEDKILETELLKSVKNINEQKAVVDFITESFEKFSTKIEYPRQPVVRKLPNIQHLWTPVKAKLKNGETLFNVLENVHPTPAICGAPWTEAMSSILEMENHDRGLYTGAVGWFNLNNEGEFAVAIRSALLQGNKVTAYAGCGIVEGSNPESEFEETKLKLKPILNLFRK